MKRIAVLQILQESNSFNPVPTERSDFEQFGLGIGEEVLTTYGSVDELGGFLEGLGRWQEPVEPVGLIRAQAWPGGPLSSDTMRWFERRLEQQLRLAGHLDGVLFALHGAMVADGEHDVEGRLLRRARAIVGPDVPIVATLDLHAYCTPEMIAAADVLVAYHTSPHLDRRETGRRAAKVLERLLAAASPLCAAVRLPMISIAEAQMSSGPVLGSLFRRVREAEGTPRILSAAVFMTQAWLDVPSLGWSTLVVADAEAALADRLAGELAEMCWACRRQMTVEYCSAQGSVERALACPRGPVVIADGADATNSGAGGDSTHLLSALRTRSIPGRALTIMVDPEAVGHARAVGCGGTSRFAVGGKRDRVFSQTIEIEGEVRCLRPARYTLNGHGGENMPIDMGMGAVVRTGDVDLLLVEHPGPGSTPMMYRCVGLEPEHYKIVVVKSPAGFRAEYEPLAAEIILSDSPGCASPRFAQMPYKRISRPLWPMDDVADWRFVEWAGLAFSNKGRER